MNYIEHRDKEESRIHRGLETFVEINEKELTSLRSELALKEKQLDAAEKVIEQIGSEPSMSGSTPFPRKGYKKLYEALEVYDQLKNTNTEVKDYTMNTGDGYGTTIGFKTLLDVKNELAKEHGYEDWAEWCRAYSWFPHKYHDEVAKRYATECIKAGWNLSREKMPDFDGS